MGGEFESESESEFRSASGLRSETKAGLSLGDACATASASASAVASASASASAGAGTSAEPSAADRSVDLRRLAVASLFLPPRSLSVRDFSALALSSDARNPLAMSRSFQRQETTLPSVDLRAEDLPRLFERAGLGVGVGSGLGVSRTSTQTAQRELFPHEPREGRISAAVEEKISRALAFYDEIGAEVIYPFHPAYPPAFYELEKPPLFLSCLGNVAALSARQRLAVVGSRELSPRTERWLEVNLREFLGACKDACLVSGGARGADQAAHLAAIRSGKPTVVFLPSGLNAIFPRNLETWVKPILESGGVFVSAYAPDDLVHRGRFESRNRLIASLSHVVFIAEAGRRSGTMMTARLAIELGRGICVLPSFPGELVGQGSLDLLQQGCQLVCDSKDLVSQMWTATPHAQPADHVEI